MTLPQKIGSFLLNFAKITYSVNHQLFSSQLHAIEFAFCDTIKIHSSWVMPIGMLHFQEAPHVCHNKIAQRRKQRQSPGGAWFGSLITALISSFFNLKRELHRSLGQRAGCTSPLGALCRERFAKLHINICRRQSAGGPTRLHNWDARARHKKSATAHIKFLNLSHLSLCAARVPFPACGIFPCIQQHTPLIGEWKGKVKARWPTSRCCRVLHNMHSRVRSLSCRAPDNGVVAHWGHGPRDVTRLLTSLPTIVTSWVKINAPVARTPSVYYRRRRMYTHNIISLFCLIDRPEWINAHQRDSAYAF